MAFSDTKKGFCRARWLATALLPILERAHRNAKQRRESCLRKPGHQTSVSYYRNLWAMYASTDTGLHFAYRR